MFLINHNIKKKNNNNKLLLLIKKIKLQSYRYFTVKIFYEIVVKN
jgi:hypothetical protein